MARINKIYRQGSTLRLTITGSSRKRKWNFDRLPGRRTLVLLLFIVAESSTSRNDGDGGRRQRSVGYAGEHIHVGSMSDGDCPVKPPCYCTDSVTTTQKASTMTTDRSPWAADHRRDDVIVVAQRIVCDSFSSVRRPRRKWSQRTGSRSRSRSLRRFPRFVESNVAVERHVMLSYSGLKSIPGAAFHAIKVRMRVYYCLYLETQSPLTFIAMRCIVDVNVNRNQGLLTSLK